MEMQGRWLIPLLALILTACQQTENAKSYPKTSTIVSVGKAHFYDLNEKRAQPGAHYSATIKPAVQMDLAFKGSGYVDSIYKVHGADGQLHSVQEGDTISRGTVLARLSPDEYQTKIRAQTEAVNETRQSQKKDREMLGEAQAGFKQAQTEYDRTARLFQSQSVTRPEYDAAKSKLDIAQARVKEQEAQINVDSASEARGSAELNQAKLALRDCRLIAPIDSVVLRRNIEEGSYVAQGTTAFTIADASTVKAVLGLPDTQLRTLKQQETVTLTSEAIPGRIFSGRITQVSPEADPKSRVFEVEVTLPNKDHRLKIGMVASLIMNDSVTDQKPQLMIPLSAIIRSTSNPDGYAVFVIKNDAGKSLVKEKQIKLGAAKGAEIAVLEGLTANETIVTAGSTRVTDGQEVKIADSIDEG